jgi:disulfide oxidoreductase YuzD
MTQQEEYERMKALLRRSDITPNDLAPYVDITYDPRGELMHQICNGVGFVNDQWMYEYCKCTTPCAHEPRLIDIYVCQEDVDDDMELYKEEGLRVQAHPMPLSVRDFKEWLHEALQ